MKAQKNRPRVSSTCQNRPRSRYSQPCIPSSVQARRQPPVDVEQLADHAAEHDHRKRSQQSVGEPRLPARLPPRDDRREEEPGGQEGRRGPEDRQLDVPGAHQVVRQPTGQVEPEEAGQVGAIVLTGGTDHRLDHEQQADDQEEVGAGPLRRRHRDVGRRPERDGVGLPTPPSHAFVPIDRRRRTSTPMPANRTIRERTLQTTTLAVTVLPTRSSGGQLLVYV